MSLLFWNSHAQFSCENPGAWNENGTLEMISIHCAGCAAAALPRHLTTELHKIEGGKKLLLYSFVPRH